MGAQDPLSESGPSRELPWAVFLGVALAASALLVVLSRNVFLFWDDFYFLGQARDADLTWSYLTDPLFKHFSPDPLAGPDDKRPRGGNACVERP